MFKPATLRIAAIIALVLSAVGLLLSLVAILRSGMFLFAAISWGLLLWASYIGFQLTSYKLYENEYQKVGYRIYAIIVAFVIFMSFGYMAGLILSVVLLSALWGLKKNYDEWNSTHSAEAADAEPAETAPPTS